MMFAAWQLVQVQSKAGGATLEGEKTGITTGGFDRYN
jgi:hypothetical protein